MGRQVIRAHELKDDMVLTNSTGQLRRLIKDVEVGKEWVTFRYGDDIGVNGRDRFSRYHEVIIWVEPDAVVEHAETCGGCGEPIKDGEPVTKVSDGVAIDDGGFDCQNTETYHSRCLNVQVL